MSVRNKTANEFLLEELKCMQIMEIHLFVNKRLHTQNFVSTEAFHIGQSN